MNFAELPEVHQNLLGNLFDPSSSVSLASLLPPGLSTRLLNSLSKDSSLYELLDDEDALLRHLEAAYRYRCPPTDSRIRMSFWLEYERALLEADKMKVANIHSLVCDERSFYRLFGSCPGRTAFLICRPAAYQEQVREMLSHGLKRMRQILDMPAILPNGKVDHKMLMLQAKITGMMDMRLHGAPTQKVQQLNLNVDAGRKELSVDTKNLIAKGDINAIQSRLMEIEKQMGDGPRQELPVLEAEVVEVASGRKIDPAADSTDPVRAPGAAKVREEE